MPKGKKVGGKDWEPGESGNPNGRPKLSEDLKKIRALTNKQLKEVGDFLLLGTRATLTEVSQNPESSLLQVWLSSVCITGIKKGDMGALNALLDRLVGKVTDKVQHTLPRPVIIKNRDGSQTVLGAEYPTEEEEK